MKRRKKAKRSPKRLLAAAEYRQQLSDLAKNAKAFVVLLDKFMAKPSNFQRGKDIAALINRFEMYVDLVRYGTLGIDFRKDSPRTPRA